MSQRSVGRELPPRLAQAVEHHEAPVRRHCRSVAIDRIPHKLVRVQGEALAIGALPLHRMPAVLLGAPFGERKLRPACALDGFSAGTAAWAVPASDSDNAKATA
ncbi:hypothetical protein NWF32_06785 [Pseudomonas qingdaonensis]|nr:hypothetical protein [Pseudomonas qingdaonensis]